MFPHFRGRKSILVLTAIFLTTFLVAPWSLHSTTGSANGQLTPHLVQSVDLNATTARISVLGAAENDNLSGDDAPDSFGTFPRAHALATGDFNNDGFDDVVIGAPDADFTPTGGSLRSGAGAVYVILGEAFGVNPITIDLAATDQPDTKIFGIAANDNLGFAVATGDVNGDGIDDLLMGAPGADFDGAVDRANTGAVFVIFGAVGFPTGTLDLATAGTADAAIFGQRTGDGFGSSIAVGDIGGANTIEDIVVGAPGNAGPQNDRTNGGSVHVVFGATTLGAGGGVIDIGATATAVTIFGLEDSLLGAAVAIGNVDGATPADILVGAPQADRPAPNAATETGAVFFFAGGTNLNPTAPATTRTFDINSATAAERPTVLIYGNSADDHLGASVSAGDVSNDGDSDILIGAPDADGRVDDPGEQEDAGEAYVITGGEDLNPVAPQTERRIDVAVANVQLTIYGSASGDHFGSTVRAVNINTNGNNDNVTDLAVGAPGFGITGRGDAGAVHVFFGGSTLTLFSERDLALQQDDFRVVGQAADDELGWAIASGDLDNNSGGDLIVGAPFHNVVLAQSTRTNAGRVYALFAQSDTIPPTNQPPTVTVTAPNGGETIQGGANFAITWTASDPNGDATIERFEIRLSTNAGASFPTIITSNVPGDVRTFQWAVPIGLNTTTARIRVIAFDDQNAQGQDDSNANFTIGDIGVTVTLTAPNGGETLRFGQAFSITWTVPDPVANQITGFDLFLSTDSGANFNTPIAFNNPTTPALGPNIRSFNWTVPSICTTTARVAVFARIQGGSTTLDASNSNFTIQDNGPTVNTAAMKLNASRTTLTLKTINPPGDAPEILFAPGAVLEISTNEAGTTFLQFTRPKRAASGKKLTGRGTINGQTLGDFFPDQAVRFLRVTNPPCGVFLVKVRRVNSLLVIEP
jgi:hypothetical protein